MDAKLVEKASKLACVSSDHRNSLAATRMRWLSEFISGRSSQDGGGGARRGVADVVLHEAGLLLVAARAAVVLDVLHAAPGCARGGGSPCVAP